ncbi:MAG TPA: glycerol kinase GlpK [Terracidiphilus sp.]|nr:glycerol kinase GlpK [Terracidiphilus sp.]
MATDCILAIDQGTTNTKAVLCDRRGRAVYKIAAPVSLLQPKPGFVEQDALCLWESVKCAAEAAVWHSKEIDTRIAAVAISNQRETALAWNAETGEPLANAVGWQCNRSAEICERVADYAPAIRARTGLPLAPLISAGKWAWLLENEDRVRAARDTGVLRLGNVDSWLVYKLTGGELHATDLTNASRTGLLDFGSLQWDSDLLAVFGIPAGSLPELRHSSGSFGVCDAIEGLNGVPVLAAIGDSHAAMFGHGRFSPGSIKATYGTGSSLMALTDGLVADSPALARTIAWSLGGTTQFALEGNIAMTGSAVQWVGEFLGLADPGNDAAHLAEGVADCAGVYFVPAMVGLGAPYWDAEARGAITGLGRSHTAAHFARAAVEAVAYQVADVFLAMEAASGAEFADLHADGGATRNGMLMQFQADILDRTVVRSRNEELSAIGAAWLAGLALGWWASPAEIASISCEGERFSAAMLPATRNALYAGWMDAVARVRRSREVRN